MFKIEQTKPYAKGYNDCIEEARMDQRRNARPELKTYPDNLDAYDVIYLGFPNYWSTMPMAVYTFPERYYFAGKTIHPFCTHEGSGLSRTESDIAQAAAGAVVTKGLAIHGSAADSARPALAAWIQEENR